MGSEIPPQNAHRTEEEARDFVTAVRGFKDWLSAGWYDQLVDQMAYLRAAEGDFDQAVVRILRRPSQTATDWDKCDVARSLQSQCESLGAVVRLLRTVGCFEEGDYDEISELMATLWQLSGQLRRAGVWPDVLPEPVLTEDQDGAPRAQPE